MDWFLTVNRATDSHHCLWTYYVHSLRGLGKTTWSDKGLLKGKFLCQICVWFHPACCKEKQIQLKVTILCQILNSAFTLTKTELWSSFTTFDAQRFQNTDRLDSAMSISTANDLSYKLIAGIGALCFSICTWFKVTVVSLSDEGIYRG